ncbi:hypothetical protein GCM10010961_11470 [Pseudodonghicola xiamenensis]|uniref:Uncharacterized protein n=1 Tax=Pseudodonghicola xiamenensis TaxID=337702 RepID=A0A8J3MCA6_9RHOB|nr:hypothetical protein GCM10010961_11470 [Pseudodonghicola xiamenensis]
MCSYDWIVMITLGLDRWEQERRPSPHEIELRVIRKLHEARKATELPSGPKGWRRWLRWRDQPAACPRPSSRATPRSSSRAAS